AALRADQLAGEAQDTAAVEAARHVALADGYVARRLKPLVLVVGGAAGTGKTTLAAALAEVLGSEVLRGVVIRRGVFGAGPQYAAADSGVYSRDARERVYEAMFHRAAELHEQRISVVLDGTFSTVEVLQKAQAIVTNPRGIFFGVECVCRVEVAQE